MKEYWRKLKEMFSNDYTSLMYFTMGFLMFGSAVVQIDDPINKVDNAIDHPIAFVWVLTLLGLFTMFISPIREWFIIRNSTMGFSFFLSIYTILDGWEHIANSSNGVWLIALLIYTFLFARSYKDLLKDKERYTKPRKEDKE